MRVVRRRRACQPQAVAQELADIEGPGGLDEGERGDSRQLEATPGAFRTCPDPRRLIRLLGCRRWLSRAGEDSRLQQHGQPRLNHVGGEAAMADAHAEEASKARCLDAGIKAFERSAKNFRPHVDAEGHLEGRASVLPQSGVRAG